VERLANIPSGERFAQAASPAPAVAAADLPLSELAGWGGYPRVSGRERRGEDLERITRDAVLTRGLGRSYGDSSLPPPGPCVVAGSPLADRVLAFDAERGIVRAEAGLALMHLNRLFLSRGWFTPVTPGTHYVTLGGMVAADVHGKNHHAVGCFGEHVRSLRMRVADGRVLECFAPRSAAWGSPATCSRSSSRWSASRRRGSGRRASRCPTCTPRWSA